MFPYLLIVSAWTLDIVHFVVSKGKLVFRGKKLMEHGVRYCMSTLGAVSLVFYFHGSLFYLILAFLGPTIPTILYLIVRKIRK